MNNNQKKALKKTMMVLLQILAGVVGFILTLGAFINYPFHTMFFILLVLLFFMLYATYRDELESLENIKKEE